jgi:hypothetical protein
MTAADICHSFDLSDDAWGLVDEDMDARQFIDALVAAKQYVAGIDFVAHALAPRDAVWWGGLCVQHTYGDDLSALDKEACRAAIRWVLDPSEANRLAAGRPAETAGPWSPAGRLALAAYQTGVALGPKGAPPARVDPHAPAKSVAAAVKLCSIAGEPIRIAGAQRAFVELGIEIGVAQGPMARQREDVEITWPDPEDED